MGRYVIQSVRERLLPAVHALVPCHHATYHGIPIIDLADADCQVDPVFHYAAYAAAYAAQCIGQRQITAQAGCCESNSGISGSTCNRPNVEGAAMRTKSETSCTLLVNSPSADLNFVK